MDKNNFKVGQILGEINTKLDHVIKLNNRLIFSMLGIIGATLGEKLVHSPIYVHMVTYAALFAAIFLGATIVNSWREIGRNRLISRILLCVFLLFSTIVRLFIYHIGVDLAPNWYSMTIDILLTLLCVFVVLELWKDHDNFKAKKFKK